MFLWGAVILLVPSAYTVFAAETNTNVSITNETIKWKLLPAISYNADAGVELGGMFQLIGFSGGKKDYAWKFQPEFIFTTGGEIRPRIFFDLPGLMVFGRPLRITTLIDYRLIMFETFDGFGGTDDELGYAASNENNYYYRYRRNAVRLNAVATVPMFGGKKIGFPWELSGIIGAYVEYYYFTNAISISGTVYPSKLMDDRPYGIAGGLSSSIIAGMSFDNRDFEPNPHSGCFLELKIEGASRVFGSMYDYLRVTFVEKAFFTLVPGYSNLVFAERFIFDELFGAVPFFKTEYINITPPSRGPGGKDIMRGVPLYRYRGETVAVMNAELRWRFFDWEMFGEVWHTELVAFTDLGMIARDPMLFTWQRLIWSGGGGFRLAWSEDFIVMLDVGVWRDQVKAYLDIDHMF